MGYAVLYLSLLVLIPLAALPIKSASLGWQGFWDAVASPRVVASYKLTFGASLIAALVNLVFGTIVAWVLVRYRFPGKKILDALVDLPFALPTAVAGIALTALYSEKGWLRAAGRVVRLEGRVHAVGHRDRADLHRRALRGAHGAACARGRRARDREAAASLGANRWQTIRRVLLPALLPALMTGFALAFARAVGEYGSVVFIAGNMPMVSEITPLLIIAKLEQFDYAGAAAIATVMLVLSFALLFVINLLQGWQARRGLGRA